MICPHCHRGTLLLISEDEPWHPDQYQCDTCDSTFGIGEIQNVENRLDTQE